MIESRSEARLQRRHHQGHGGAALVVERPREPASLQRLGGHGADRGGLDRAVGLHEPLQHERLHARGRELDGKEEPDRASAGDDDVVGHDADTKPGKTLC
ncbi:MAG: hypothetical protein QM820_37245 [Minicystis sp.]